MSEEGYGACPDCLHAVGQSDCYCGSGCACRLSFAALRAERARAERYATFLLWALNWHQEFYIGRTEEVPEALRRWSEEARAALKEEP